MKKEKHSIQGHIFSRLYFLLGALVLLGIIFRFIYLDRKVFWLDEACTLLRISGHAEVDVLQQFSFDHIAPVEALQQYQRPHAETGFIGTLKGLATEEPQLAPLYFVLLYGWVKAFGDSITAVRSLSAVFGVLVLPALYCLGRELFRSALPTWIAIGLVSISPLHVGFAQEARPYAFWTFIIVASSAALLGAVRLNTRLSWLIYTITIPISIYSFLLSVLVVVTHGVYVICHERFRFSKITLSYSKSLLIGLALSAGWLLVVIFNLISIPQLKGGSRAPSKGFVAAIREIIGGIRNCFFDLNHGTDQDFYVFGVSPNPVLNLFILALFIYCLFLLWKTASGSTFSFLLALIILTGSPLLVKGSYFLPRYLIPFYLGIHLTIAWGLANQIGAIPSHRRFHKNLPQIILIFLFSISILACIIGLQKETSWIKHKHQENQMAVLINQSDRPLLISDATPCELLPFSHYLSSKVSLQLEPKCGLCTADAASFERPFRVPSIPAEFSHVFLYSPSKELLDTLSKTHTVQPVQEFSNGSNQLYLVE